MRGTVKPSSHTALALLPGNFFTVFSFLCCNLFGKKKQNSFPEEETLTSKADLEVYIIELAVGKRLKTAHSYRCLYMTKREAGFASKNHCQSLLDRAQHV